MRAISLSCLVLQIVCLLAWCALFLLELLAIGYQGGGLLNAGFGMIQTSRLAAAMAPIFVLPLTIVVGLLAHKKRRYRAAILMPIAVVSVAYFAGRGWLVYQPDPIADNFGQRDVPYTGFLVLPTSAIPPGYQQISHHYTKREYTVRLAKIVDETKFDLDLIDSDITQLVEPHDPPIIEFVYKGCPGRVYAYHEHLTGKAAFALYWLNAPKQRLSISVEQVPSGDWSPDDLISLLRALVPV